MKKHIKNITHKNDREAIFEFPEERIDGLDSFYEANRFDGCVGESCGCSEDFWTALWLCECAAYEDSNYTEGIYSVTKWVWSDNEDMYINIGGFDLEGFLDELPEYIKIIKNNGF